MHLFSPYLVGTIVREMPRRDAMQAISYGDGDTYVCLVLKRKKWLLPQACDCDAYVTRNTCDNNKRRLTTSGSYGSTGSSGTSCRSYQVKNDGRWRG